MQQASRLQGKWRNAVFFTIALLVVIADQLIKIWIRSYSEGQTIFEAGFCRITRIHNTGAVFGSFQDQSFALIVVNSVVIAILLLYGFFISRRFPYLDSMLSKFALGLILGGAAGNLIDRLRFGYVTDFIGIGIWPAFNIADSAIVVGVIILACSLLRLGRTDKR